MISGNTLLTVACEYCRCASSDFVCHAGLAIRQPPCSITPRHRVESATKTIKFFVAHTVNYVLCNNHTRIDWVLLNFTLVIQQNYHQPGRKFEKLFCAVGRLSCQLELSKSETSKFRSELVFDIVNGFEFRLLCCWNFMGQECAGIVPMLATFLCSVYIYWTIFCPTSLTISDATWAPTRLRPIKL